jgi:phage gpG-like protein
MTQPLELTEDQKEFIKENAFRISDLAELTRATFMNESLDGRTKEGRAVRAFLATQEIEYSTKHVSKKEDVVLREEQKDFIRANCGPDVSSLELAKLVFSDNSIKHLSKAFWAVHEFIEEEGLDLAEEETALSVKYTPPKAESRIIKKINDCVGVEITEDKMTVQYKRSISALGKFMSAPRFLQVIETYTSIDDRDLFEAEFVRATWDKPDLTTDEINLYINVCMDYIHLKRIQSAMNKLNRMFDEAEDQQDLTVRLAELLKTKSEEYNQCEKRMESLISKLQGDRSKRIQSQVAKNASILNLVQLFQEEEERLIMVKMAEMQKKVVRKEADKLESMPEWKSRVLGISKDDII